MVPFHAHGEVHGLEDKRIHDTRLCLLHHSRDRQGRQDTRIRISISQTWTEQGPQVYARKQRNCPMHYGRHVAFKT